LYTYFSILQEMRLTHIENLTICFYKICRIFVDSNNHISVAPLCRDFRGAGGKSRQYQLYARETEM